MVDALVAWFCFGVGIAKFDPMWLIAAGVFSCSAYIGTLIKKDSKE